MDSSKGIRGKYANQFTKPVKVTIHSAKGDAVFKVTKVAPDKFQWKRVAVSKRTKR